MAVLSFRPVFLAVRGTPPDETQGVGMGRSGKLGFLKVLLAITGLFCVFCVYPLTVLWPSGWAWHASGQSLYLQMIIGIYATLGVFLLIAVRDPLQHLSLIWFAASWRSRRFSIRSTGDISSATCPC
jgi:hypothetical protein